MDDVYATTGSNLADQYGRAFVDTLLRYAEGRDKARLIDAFESWKSSGGLLSVDARDLLWSVVYKASVVPPTDPAEILRIIKEDRVFREGRVLRSIDSETRSSLIATPNPNPRKGRTMSEAEAAAARKRINENATITVATEEGKNPKRNPSASYDRFALYRDGMTVKEAKEAGLLAVDISHDSEKGYITLTDPEPSAEAEETPAPKKRRSKAASEEEAAA
jgi:hypothetical protein